jgi:hypothetical protein
MRRNDGHRREGSRTVSNLLAWVSLYAAGLATGEAFSMLFVEGSSRAFLTMLGGALAGSSSGRPSGSSASCCSRQSRRSTRCSRSTGGCRSPGRDGEISSQKPEGTYLAF